MAVVQVTGEITSDVIKPKSYQTVWVKPTWDSDWEWVPYISPRWAEEAAAPVIGPAEFIWSFGSILEHGAAAFSTYTPLQLEDWYIAVTDYTIWGKWTVWIGVVQAEAIQNPSTRSSIGYGDQVFGAFDLGYLLQRRRVIGAYVEGGGNYIDRNAVFNQRFDRGLSFQGNRTTTANGDGIHTFSDDGEEWTNLDIAKYLLYYYQPPNITFALSGQYEALADIVEKHDFGGMTVRDALNKLISRQRGLGWRIMTISEGAVEIFVWSILSEDLSVDGYTIPANPFQDTINTDGLIDVKPVIKISRAHSYDKIVVQGARIKTAMSIAFSNSTLEEGWTGAEETAYKAETEDTERSTDKYQRVYRFFRVPRAWNWQYNSLKDASAQVANPSVSANGDVDLTTVGGYWNQGHRFENYLPFEVTAAAAGAEPEFRQPFVLVEYESGKYAYVDTLQAVDLGEYAVKVANREMGIVVRGIVNHIFALNHFDDADPGTEPSDTEPEIDYDTMIATVFVATDSRIKVEYNMPENEASEAAKELPIEVPDAEFWWAAGGTVCEVTDESLVYWGDGSEAQIIRDDRPKLRAIAAAAAAWYGQQRNTLRYSYDGLGAFHPVGMLVQAVASYSLGVANIGTVVTNRRWNFQQGSAGNTMVRTGYSELDTKALVG